LTNFNGTLYLVQRSPRKWP